MHREQPVEDLGRNKVIMWTDKLDADYCRFNPGNHEEEQRVGDI
jgi:hypothetical protein